MSELYPFLMVPIFDPRPWGTLDLSPIYPNHKFTEKIGESWLTGDHCIVANGPLAGRSLNDLSVHFGKEFVGEAAPDGNRFPLLLKFLFPHEQLSVQVHPDDECARRSGQPWGKTECWYVAHAEPGAQVALGLREGATCAQLEQAIQENRAEQLLNWVDIHRGDLVYVAGGTVHTLGPGSVIVETQQQSDTTYRLYDYGRPRELHLEQGLAAVKERPGSGKVARPPAISQNGTRQEQLVAAPYFVVEKFNLKDPKAFSTTDESGTRSVQILVALEGCGAVEAHGVEPITFAKGDAVVVPASTWNFEVRPQWALEFIRAYVPGKPLPEPATTLNT
ncbi:MAG TPA: type I phosphomannose isomerase catalytic subunit [Terriglobales bacterium]|jgi:mannose-6-phosphate isomerase